MNARLLHIVAIICMFELNVNMETAIDLLNNRSPPIQALNMANGLFIDKN